MSECETFVKLICKCGDSAGQHVPVGDHLGGCEGCDGCVVFIPAVSPDPDPERVARWQAIGQEYALSQRTVDGLLGPGERIPTASTVERRVTSERDEVTRGTVGEERQPDRSAQPGSSVEPNPLFEPARRRRPTPAPRGGTPAAY